MVLRSLPRSPTSFPHVLPLLLLSTLLLLLSPFARAEDQLINVYMRGSGDRVRRWAVRGEGGREGGREEGRGGGWGGKREEGKSQRILSDSDCRALFWST